MKINRYDKKKITEIRAELELLFDDPLQKVEDECMGTPSKSTISRFFNFNKIKPSSALKIHNACKELKKRGVKEDNKILYQN